jgi:preprotein translocase subunit SecD
MNRRIRTRLLITFLVTLFCVYLFAGFPPAIAKMRDRIHLGLDLQGGIHLQLQVVTDDAVRAETDRAVESLREFLQDNKIPFRQLVREDHDRFLVVALDPGRDADFQRYVVDRLPDWTVVSSVGEGPATYTVTHRPERVSALREETVDQTITTLQNRIDALGVVEPTIRKHGRTEDYRILVELPGITDADRVKNIMRATALLELKLVDNGPFASEAAARQSYGAVLPAHLEALPMQEGGAHAEVYYVVQRVASITGRDLKNAFPSRDENGRPAVGFNLTAEGSRRFERLTEQNIGKRLAIALDGRIQSAPGIETRISDSAIIKGGPAGFAPQEARDLALVLRSGALPATVNYAYEGMIGASLGADSIRAGVTAAVAALIGIAAFMLFYYRWSGLNATIAMILNLVILLAAMAYFGQTLTLPGIAAVSLTIGVGIDSNVLIFERIREELRAGATAARAVSAGFERVLVTLIDTHLAALISAMFLLMFGSGPVRGFAVTLVIGLISNIFTAVFVSRTMFDWMLARQKSGASISI